MNLKSIVLIALLAISLICCKQGKIIELPLSIEDAFSPFPRNLTIMEEITENENHPLKNTWLKASKLPEGLTDMKYGNIVSNMYQHVYQNYLSGNIPEDLYNESNFHRMWEDVDTLTLSRNPIQTQLAFAYGKDAEGMIKIVVDTNGNLDLSDDKLFTPLERNPAYYSTNPDSLISAHSLHVPFEIFIQNGVVPVSIPLFVLCDSQANMAFYNLSICATAQYKGVKIVVSPGHDLLYQDVQDINIAIMDNLKEGKLVKSGDVCKINDYIEIENKVYKIIGVNTNKFTLVLERIGLPKTELFAAQKGYKPHPFQGEEITTKSIISLEGMKGKYVLLDFWSEGCGSCIKDIPDLKELYAKTDRSEFEIIGIAGSSSLDAIKRLIDKHEITWPQILSDETNKITETYNVKAYPTTVLINPEGIIISKNLRGKELEEEILSLINK